MAICMRLAQRVPVRIQLDRIPPGVKLAMGMTCTVTLRPLAGHSETFLKD